MSDIVPPHAKPFNLGTRHLLNASKILGWKPWTTATTYLWPPRFRLRLQNVSLALKILTGHNAGVPSCLLLPDRAGEMP